MPELPEVETIRRHLAPHVDGRTLERLEIHDARWSLPLAPAGALRRARGPPDRAARPPRQVPRVGARGRGLPAAAPADDRHAAAQPARAPAAHARDLRASATASCSSSTRGASAPASSRSATRRARRSSPPRLGVEPFEPEFTGEHLYALAAHCRAPIKAMLLDQKRIAGVGNIYADEALFRARIHPLRRADRITRKQASALRDAVVETLQIGIDSKGATIDDFRDPDGCQGSFQDRFLIHLGRASRACAAAGRCGSCAPGGAGPTSARSASRALGAKPGSLLPSGARPQPRRGPPAGRRGRP